MKNIKVFKIGGSILRKPEDFLKIASNLLKNYKRAKICVVTSAMKGKTDELVEVFKRAVPEADFWDFERFIPSGEIEAALLFESVFKYLRIKSKAVLPWMKEWPLYISLLEAKNITFQEINNKRNFRILELSRTKTKKMFLPLFKKYRVLILPGFIAKDGRGRVFTLGRGGSDVSAILIAELLNIKEVNFIKDTGSILNTDPAFSKETRALKFIEADKLGILTSSGARVLNPMALKFTDKVNKIRVFSPELKKGTKVKFTQGVTIKKSEEIFSVFTFIGKRLPETPGILSKISEILSRKNISIYSITVSDNLLAIYLKEEDTQKGYSLLSPLISRIKNLEILNVKRGIQKIILRSLKFINEPGIVKKIVTPISKQGINIWEILTVHTDIMIFVEKENSQKVFFILKKLFIRR